MTHKFTTLLRLAGLENELDTRKQNDTVFASNWSVLAGPSGWSETWRYQPIGKTQQASADLLDALENTAHGLLPWLKKKW